MKQVLVRKIDLTKIEVIPLSEDTILLYRQGCSTKKYTTRKIHTKLHPGPEWRIFHIVTSEDIDDVISRSFTAVRCKQSVKNGE